MKKKLRIVVMMLAVMMLAGCSASSSKGSVYSKYIQSVMDGCYKGDLKAYTDVCDATNKEAQEVYDNTVEYYAYQLMYYNDVDSQSISEDVIDLYVELARDIMAKTKYTVNKANNVSGNYQVQVDIQPVDINDITYDAIEDAIDAWNSKYSAEATANFTEEQWLVAEDEYAKSVYDILRENVDKIGYKDVVSKVVIITVDKDGYYGISDSDWEDIDDMVVDMK